MDKTKIWVIILVIRKDDIVIKIIGKLDDSGEKMYFKYFRNDLRICTYCIYVL